MHTVIVALSLIVMVLLYGIIRYYSIMCMSRALLYYVLKSGLVAAVVFNCCRDRPEYCCILLLLLACMV